MALRIIGLIALVAAAWGNAQAVTCYEVIDAGDNTLYSATVPPFPLNGAEWSNGQTRLRQQGRHLLWFDASSCPETSSSTLYASVNPTENAADLLPARRGFTRGGGIYTREAATAGPVGVAGRAPVVVVPTRAAVTAPSGGAPGYGR